MAGTEGTCRAALCGCILCVCMGTSAGCQHAFLACWKSGLLGGPPELRTEGGSERCSQIRSALLKGQGRALKSSCCVPDATCDTVT